LLKLKGYVERSRLRSEIVFLKAGYLCLFSLQPQREYDQMYHETRSSPELPGLCFNSMAVFDLVKVGFGGTAPYFNHLTRILAS
jgi:hypothetical protein